MPREMPSEERLRFLSFGTRTGKVATVMADGRPHVMPVWFVLGGEEVVFTTGAESVKGRNLRRDPRMSLCVEDGMRYVTLEGWAELIEDRAQQEREVNELIAPRYIGRRLGSNRWKVIQGSDRIGIRHRSSSFVWSL